MPYLTGISTTNLGSRNNGLPGDVIVGTFKPLDASFTNDGHADDTYFMIVNGLSRCDRLGRRLPTGHPSRFRLWLQQYRQSASAKS